MRYEQMQGDQRVRHEALIEATGNIFAGDNGGGEFKKRKHPHILEKGINNLYEHIRNGVDRMAKEQRRKSYHAIYQ